MSAEAFFEAIDDLAYDYGPPPSLIEYALVGVVIVFALFGIFYV